MSRKNNTERTLIDSHYDRVGAKNDKHSERQETVVSKESPLEQLEWE